MRITYSQVFNLGASRVQIEKLKAVKARLIFEEVSQHSESGTPSRKRDLRKRLESRRIRSVSGSPEPRHGRSESPRKRDPERKTVFKRLEKGVFHRLGDKGKTISAYSSDSRRQSYHNSNRDTESCYQSSRSRGTELTPEKNRNKRASSRRPKVLSESKGSAAGHWKSRPKNQRACMPSHVKTYDGSEDPEDQLKIFQAAAKVERWAMPTWFHMFNSTLTRSARVWFDDLPPESIDSYDDLKEAFLVNFCQQKKCIKDPVEIHHIKQREGESMKDFVRRFKVESRDVKGAPEIMRISGFMHGITNPKLIKRLHEKIPKSVDEMMGMTTSFLRGEVAASNQERKKSISPWKQQEAGHKQNFKKGGFKNQQRLRLKIKNQMVPATAPLIGFSGKIIWPLGQLSLLVKIRDEEHSTSAWMNFVIVRSSSTYNEIIIRPKVKKIQAISSTAHGMIKFPVAGGILTLKSNKIIPIECAVVSGPEGQPPAAHQAIIERIKVATNPDYQEETIMIGSTRTKEG
nr:reverse transcriptase domain-containing protein [Tanacetum cinerariifolium]